MQLPIKNFLESYAADYQIIIDFYSLLPEDKYDFRLVDKPERKSDSPRESLAHILEVQLMYMQGSKSGKLEFKDMGVEHYWQMSKEELTAETRKLNQELVDHLSANDFNLDKIIDCPWGESTHLGLFYALRSHLILHEGWNLALMDILDLPRYDSLKRVWG